MFRPHFSGTRGSRACGELSVQGRYSATVGFPCPANAASRRSGRISRKGQRGCLQYAVSGSVPPGTSHGWREVRSGDLWEPVDHAMRGWPACSCSSTPGLHLQTVQPRGEQCSVRPDPNCPAPPQIAQAPVAKGFTRMSCNIGNVLDVLFSGRTLQSPFCLGSASPLGKSTVSVCSPVYSNVEHGTESSGVRTTDAPKD